MALQEPARALGVFPRDLGIWGQAGFRGARDVCIQVSKGFLEAPGLGHMPLGGGGAALYLDPVSGLQDTIFFFLFIVIVTFLRNLTSPETYSCFVGEKLRLAGVFPKKSQDFNS
jgi:hypothetical protein